RARAGDAGEGVEHGVEIGREGEAEVLVVVAGVDDRGEVLAAQPVQAVGKLRRTDLPDERHDGSHAAILTDRQTPLELLRPGAQIDLEAPRRARLGVDL